MFHRALPLLALLALACDAPMPSTPDASTDAGTTPRPAPTCSDGELNGGESAVDCGGFCAPCPAGRRCVEATDCGSGSCGDGYCLAPACDDGVRNGGETTPDCGGTCPGCAGGAECMEDSACLSGRCARGLCEPSTCEDGAQTGQESDVDCGGALCPGCAIGGACESASDCASARCVDGACAAGTCEDRIQNQDESSADCGGSCSACATGLSCRHPDDCASGRCAEGACVSCSDGLRNADEVDVDCGGASCGACRDGSRCDAEADCLSGRCVGGHCLSCFDGEQNADESDVDCGGESCGACATDLACGSPSDCRTQVCVDGTCDAIGDTCATAFALATGDNDVAWLAGGNEYLTGSTGCGLTRADGPDLVLQFTATLDGVVRYRIDKPVGARWHVVVHDAPCGALEVDQERSCDHESDADRLEGQLDVEAGRTYFFYLVDAYSPLMEPMRLDPVLHVNIEHFAPPCRPGVGGMLAGIDTPRPSGTGLNQIYVRVDPGSSGLVYVGGSRTLRRVPVAGPPSDDLVDLATLTQTQLGRDVLVSGDEVFTLTDRTSGADGRLFRITTDGGASWIGGGEDYAHFDPAPAGGLVSGELEGSTLYLLSGGTTSSLTQVWAVEAGANALPVDAALLGSFERTNCSGIALDSEYFYTVCADEDELLRVHRTSFAVDVIAATPTAASPFIGNGVEVHDLSADGRADVVYFSPADRAAYYACGLDQPTAFVDLLAEWRGSSSPSNGNYGFDFHPATGVLYGFDRSTRLLHEVR